MRADSAIDHPLLLQASYYKAYLNSRALQVLALTDNTTGVIEESGVRQVAARLPVATGDRLEASTKSMLADLNQAGLPLHVHANLTNTIDAFLDPIEAVHKEHPITNLRWTLAHVNQINARQLERMKRLGMYAAVHPWAVINGGINRTVFGEAAIDMPPLKTIQDSGIMWGLGSDGSRANQISDDDGRRKRGVRALKESGGRNQEAGLG